MAFAAPPRRRPRPAPGGPRHRAPRRSIMSTVNDTAARDLGREDLQLVAEGDKRAFARLYDAWAPTLFALISCVLKDRAQAEEVLQDTFLHVWRRAPSYDPGRGSVRAWLTTIARRRAIDRVRSAQAARDRELASWTGTRRRRRRSPASRAETSAARSAPWGSRRRPSSSCRTSGD